MNKTFSVENMQTYFRNYVPCIEHRRQPITNFCTERICLKFMCPQCVENHSRTHVNHPIQSIKTCIRKSSAQIQKTLSELELETNQNYFLKYKSPQEYENELINELEEVRKSLIEDINLYFKQKQSEVRRQTSKTSQIKNKISNLQNQLTKAVAQLKLLDRNLLVNQQCVNAIKKANKIDYVQLVNHFKSKIQDVREDLDYNLKVELNSNKREEFRRVLSSLIGIKANRNKMEKNKNNSRKKFDPYRQPSQQQLGKSQRVEYVVNPPPLSADRLLNQAAFKINNQNYFQSEPFLHFFQVSKPNLHFLKLKQLRQNEPPKWSTITLDINFPIPSFNRTIATENGNIYIIGGTIVSTLQKSKIIYQFDPLLNTLKPVSQLNIGRSSHSVVCLKKMVYIVGGMDAQDQIPKRCEVFNSKTNQCKYIASSKYQTINSTLCSIGKDKLVKLGGVDSEGKNSDFIQIYHITSDNWEEIDPIIEQQIKSQFGLLSCCGWATLNEDQIFIFGGYNQEASNQNSKTSFVFQYNKQDKQSYIKYINMKNIPIAEGFWNPQSVTYNGIIYALQNVDGYDEHDCLEDRRNLLIFNGKNWSMYNQSE